MIAVLARLIDFPSDLIGVDTFHTGLLLQEMKLGFDGRGRLWLLDGLLGGIVDVFSIGCRKVLC